MAAGLPYKLLHGPVYQHKESPLTGISEILVLILLICAVLIVPRMMAPAPKKSSARKAKKGLSAKMRAGIVLSVLVPVVSALVLKPWAGNIIPFVIAGILPVAIAWAGFWIISARKNG